MPYSVMPIFFFQILLYIIIVSVIFYLINKWINNSIEVKREQNEILREALEVLKQKMAG